MAVNKVVINRDGAEDVLVDLTADTINADALVVGFTAHDKKGETVAGVNPYAKAETDATVNAQTDLIQQIKGAIAENVNKTSSEVSEQATLIQQIKTALADKAADGFEEGYSQGYTEGGKAAIAALPIYNGEVEDV